MTTHTDHHPTPQASLVFRAGAKRFVRALSSVVAIFLSTPLFPQLPPIVGSAPETGAEMLSVRRSMVDSQVRRRGVKSTPLLDAMEQVPRHLFVPELHRGRAYDGEPITFAPGQTLSHAYLSGRMIELLQLDGSERVLEIGTGSGYDAALLSRLVREVYTIEIDPGLAERARATLDRLGYENVHVRVGDGYRGWPEKAPFDAILLTTAPENIPEPLLAQLRVGGRMVIAVGGLVQDLQVVTKTDDGREIRRFFPVRLGPMTGETRDNR